MQFDMDLRRSLTPYHHLGTNSGHGVVQPLMPTVCGVADVFCPPLAARNMRMLLEFELDGRRVVDDGNFGKGDCGLLYSGGTWKIDRIVRTGTYHHRADGKLYSMSVTSELFALRERAGFALRITALNRCGRQVKLSARVASCRACPTFVPLSQWDYSPPRPGDDMAQISATSWSNGIVDVNLHAQGLTFEIAPGASVEFSLAMTMSRCGTPADPTTDAEPWIEQTITAWQGKLAVAQHALPSLKSDIPGLEKYYDRSLASGLVCLWDRRDFVTDPFIATSGIDGGGICCYPWDTTGYAPNAAAMLLGKGLTGLANAMVNAGLDRHSRFSVDGTGRDVPYAYSAHAFVSLAWTSALHLGVDRRLFEYAAAVFQELESRLSLRRHLADYGFQHNLLEMRQAGYEHFVASPNAERAWCYRRLADIGERLGDPRVQSWRKEADDIIAAIRQELWSADAGFFKCLYPDGEEETVLSIQGFDAMRCGACTPEMQRAMLRHVREGAFLGAYGVSSVSAEDSIHYELNDPDWSGGGAYTGDGPLLALTLWEQGHSDLAWDVLQRHFWMGESLVYYPQEHYCDRPAVPPHKRANVIAGLSGAEAILLGFVGMRPALDGTLTINPGWPANLRGTVELQGVSFRNRRLDIHIDNGRLNSRPASGS